MSETARTSGTARTGWIDIARSICIVMVVAMHSTLGVDSASNGGNFMHSFVVWTMPFRMPDFFFVAGMLAASAVTLNWRSFIDAKILHFAYFYLLWLLIALAVRAALKPGESFAELPLDYVKALVEPFGMLWFIHILPAMYFILRLSAARWLWPAVAVSMALHFWASLNLTGNGDAMGAHMTGSTFADSMALYLVYFMLGYTLRHHVHNWAGFAARTPRFAILALAAWFIMHAAAMTAGIAQKPFVTLFFGLAGAMAIVTIAALIARTFAGSFATLFGRNSLAIYLAFGIPMVIAREALQRSGFDIDPGLRALAITGFALVTPFAMRIIARQAGFEFLFRRPQWARLGPARTQITIPAADTPRAKTATAALLMTGNGARSRFIRQKSG